MATTGEASDFGLRDLAVSLGKTTAVDRYTAAASLERAGDFKAAMSLYSQAYRLWPALDSIIEGGLPALVRSEAEAAGLRCVLAAVDVSLARRTSVVRARALLTAADIAAIEATRTCILATETVLENNAQNVTHQNKECLFLNNAPDRVFCTKAPHVLAKILRFADSAWKEQRWSDADVGGPLHAIRGGVEGLSIRVIEYWRYQPGGGLTDLLHYDTDSVLTIVAQLSTPDEEYEGGVFRTHEMSGEQLEHPMELGDVVCLVSHKYHNVTSVTRGRRRVLVMELWQGGSAHTGR
jgi:hypothetical protein